MVKKELEKKLVVWLQYLVALGNSSLSIWKDYTGTARSALSQTAVCTKEQSIGAAQTAAAADKLFLENSGIYVEKET